MKRATKLLFFVGIGVFFSSCFETEEFPNVPQIEFDNIRFVDVEGSDSLLLSFRFEDGDGNIGLTSTENTPPYHAFSLVVDSDDSLVTISSDGHQGPFFQVPFANTQIQGVQGNFLFFGDSSFLSNTITRPPYDCEFYQIIENDTLLSIQNEFNNNLHVEFLGKPPGGTQFDLIDFREGVSGADCTFGNFDGRIPIFDPDGKEGVITYAMLSIAYRLTFGDDSIKLRFYIYDRELNRSNTAESDAFVFTDLL